MKKFMVLSALLLSSVCAQAADWQWMNSNFQDFDIYLDRDSVKYVNGSDILYAIRYGYQGKPQKVAYLKTDASKNYIGVIASEEYSEKTYRPKTILANPHVFMKPVNTDSFLFVPHRYLITVRDKKIQQAYDDVRRSAAISQPQEQVTSRIEIRDKDENIVPASYKAVPEQKDIGVTTIKDYISALRTELDNNWKPPKSGKETQTVIIIAVGSDGSLRNYKFAQSSGDADTDRSVLSAVEKTVPFPKFPNLGKPVNYLNFQFIFDYGKVKKSVL